MPRIDAVSTQEPHENEAILYRLPAPIPMPPDALPAPRIDLLKQQGVLTLSRFLAVFFPPMFTCRRGLRGGAVYPIRVFADRASIVTDCNTAVPLKCTLARLMDVVPDINDWLCAWMNSVERTPSLSPPWAVHLGLDEDGVDAVAIGIATRVAEPDESTVIIRDYQRREVTVKVPARAKLRLRSRSKRKKTRKLADIRGKEDARVGPTAGGEKVVCVGDLSGIPESGEVTVDPKTLHRTTILVPKKIKVRRRSTTATEEEE